MDQKGDGVGGDESSVYTGREGRLWGMKGPCLKAAATCRDGECEHSLGVSFDHGTEAI